MQLTDEDWLNIEREECALSLSYFIQRAWSQLEPSQPYLHGWHIDALAEHLTAITDGHINRLLINIPPGTMKSMLTGVFWPAWEWGPKQLKSKRIIGASHEAGLATRDSMMMRRLVTSEWYQKLWPIQLVGDQNQKTYFQNSSMGWRQACAVGSMTGRRGDRVIWDDPHSVEDSHSQAAMDEAARVFRETLPTRLNNPDSSAIIIVMQRLAENDISGIILDNDFGYEHLMLPMEYEPKRHCSTKIGFNDPRTIEGELLFPARFPRHVVDRDRAIMGTKAAEGQFQQRPSPRGGELIKSEWFKRYSMLPAIEYRIIYADTAQKTKEHNDYSVFECWGKAKDGSGIYLIDMIRGKWEAPELKRRALEFWLKHKNAPIDTLGGLRQMKVEDKASGTGLIQELKVHHDGTYIPIAGIQRNRDKYTRLLDVLPQIEAGFVHLPDSAPFVSDFVTECERFTADDSHSHDDQIDPMIDAINDMCQQSTVNQWLKYAESIKQGGI